MSGCGARLADDRLGRSKERHSLGKAPGVPPPQIAETQGATFVPYCCPDESLIEKKTRS
jgi:hypothetical protein